MGTFTLSHCHRLHATLNFVTTRGSPAIVYTALILLFALLVVAYLARRPILRTLGGFLVIWDEPSAWDAIVLLNGNISTRAYRAAALYRSCPAPVLMARLADTEEVRLGVVPNTTDASRALLTRLGVADADISIVSSDRWVAGTWVEATILCAHIRAHGYRSVALVTDAFHTRRARWTFRNIMQTDGTEFFCVPTSYSLSIVAQWWRSEYGLLHVVVEYLKFIHYRRLLRSAGRRPPAESDLPPAAPVRRLVAGYPTDEPDGQSDDT